MSEEPNNDDIGPETPVLPDPNRRRFDQTMKLDRVIAGGNLSTPSNFGRYEVRQRIGVGGFASVYAAWDPELESEVAIKVLAENHSANTVVRQRFVAEARVARRLGNERLIGVFDLGETDDGRPFVVMELAPRGTLRQRVVRTGRPSRDDLIRLITELGACMTAIHDKGVVHRDIKPSNLLFRTDGDPDFLPLQLIDDDERLVLADFGLARDIRGGASGVTVGGGTEGYMAPEQAVTDGKPDVRADLFSATVVVAEFTTGRHPDRLDLTSADLSTDMLAVLTRSLAIDREQRPPTAEAWCELLVEAYAADGAVGQPPPIARHDATTAALDPTRIGGPVPARTEYQTEIPHTGIEPVSFAPGARADNPAPPPGLAPEHGAAPYPAAGAHPNAIIAAARAQAEAEQRDAARKAEERAAERAAKAERRRRRREPGPAARRPGPAGPYGPTPAAPGPNPVNPADAGPGPTAGAPGAPVPPHNPQAPRPAQQTPPGQVPHAPAAAAAGAGPGTIGPTADQAGRRPPQQAPIGGQTAPPARPSPPATQAPAAPQRPGPSAAPRPDTLVPGARAPGGPPPSPQRTPGQGPGGVPGARPTTTPPVGVAPPVTGGPGPGPAPNPVTAPGGYGAATGDRRSAEISRERSREHMRTAGRLAKLERKQRRRTERRNRRRRRRRKVANFFLAIIRGLFGALVFFLVAGTAATIAIAPVDIDQRPGVQSLVGLAGVLGFVWGMSYFPFPRSYDV